MPAFADDVGSMLTLVSPALNGRFDRRRPKRFDWLAHDEYSGEGFSSSESERHEKPRRRSLGVQAAQASILAWGRNVSARTLQSLGDLLTTY